MSAGKRSCPDLICYLLSVTVMTMTGGCLTRKFSQGAPARGTTSSRVHSRRGAHVAVLSLRAFPACSREGNQIESLPRAHCRGWWVPHSNKSDCGFGRGRALPKRVCCPARLLHAVTRTWTRTPRSTCESELVTSLLHFTSDFLKAPKTPGNGHQRRSLTAKPGRT